MKKNITFILFMLFVFGCGTVKDDDNNKNKTTTDNVEQEDDSKYKLTSDYKNFTLSWGYNNSKDSKLMGYRLYDNGRIDFYQQDKNTNKVVSDSITKIPMKRVLKILEYTNNTYLYTPALNEPGNECKYVELVKPSVKFYSKAQWNEHNTYGSKTFRQLFDTLLTLIPLKY